MVIVQANVHGQRNVVNSIIMLFDMTTNEKKQFWLTDCWFSSESSKRSKRDKMPSMYTPPLCTVQSTFNMHKHHMHLNPYIRGHWWYNTKGDNQNMQTDDIKMQRITNTSRTCYSNNAHQKPYYVVSTSSPSLVKCVFVLFFCKRAFPHRASFWRTGTKLNTVFWFVDHGSSSAVIPICEHHRYDAYKI